MDTVSRARIKEMRQIVVPEVASAKLILNIGCGTGEFARMLVSQKSAVHGFDMNDAMIKEAQERNHRYHLENTFKAIHMACLVQCDSGAIRARSVKN